MNLLRRVEAQVRYFSRVRNRAQIASRILEMLQKRGISIPRVLGVLTIGQNISGEEMFLLPYFQSAPRGAVVDVGANVGSWTERILRMGRRVIAFEPDPRAYRSLRLMSKRWPTLTFYPCALGGRNGTAEMAFAFTPNENSILHEVDSTSVRRVRLRTLDSFVLEGIGAVKIDTEGSELQVLRGAVNTIQRCHPRLLIEAHGKGTYSQAENSISSMLKSLGYSCRIVHRRADGQPHMVADFTGVESIHRQNSLGKERITQLVTGNAIDTPQRHYHGRAQ